MYIKTYKIYLESKEIDFDEEFMDEEDPLEGNYYWINYKKADGVIKLYKIYIEFVGGKVYIYRDLKGNELTASEHEFIENDLMSGIQEPDWGVSLLFKSLGSRRFKEFYLHYFNEKFNKKLLNDMDSDGLIVSKKYSQEQKHYGNWSTDGDDWGNDELWGGHEHDKNEDEWGWDGNKLKKQTNYKSNWEE